MTVLVPGFRSSSRSMLAFCALLAMSCKSSCGPNGADKAAGGGKENASPTQPSTTTRRFGCGIGECVNMDPGSLCGPIDCNYAGDRWDEHVGFIKSGMLPFKNRRVRTQFLDKTGVLFHSLVTCIAQMAPTRKVGAYLVWMRLRLEEDGRITLHSVQRVGRPTPGERVPGDLVQGRTIECLEAALAGQTIYDPNYVDDIPCEPDEPNCDPTPRTRFPKSLFKFDVEISNNDVVDWPARRSAP